jgi:HK97 family phage prohead protease
MDLKICTVKVKAIGDDTPDGTFQAYASVFDNIDSYGDVVRKGAFDRTLKEWGEREAKLPLLWGHDMYDPFSNIGYVAEAKEDDHGLWVEGVLDLDNPKAAQVYRLLKSGRIDQMSFAFDTMKAQHGTVEGADVNELLDLTLYEVSVVPLGANAETEVLMVKSLTEGIKDPAGLRTAMDQIQAGVTALKNVLAAVGGSEDEDKASVSEPVKSADAPDGGKADDEPTRMTSALTRLNLELASGEFESLEYERTE